MVQGDCLIKNASQSDIVENDVFKKVLSEVKDSIDDVVIGLVDSYADNQSEYDFHRRLQARDYLLEVIEARFRARKYEGKSPLLRKLASVDLFETTEKKFTNLGVLTEQLKRAGIPALLPEIFQTSPTLTDTWCFTPTTRSRLIF